MFVALGSRTEATQRLPRGMTANRMGLSSYDGDHDRKCNPWHPGGGLADDDVVIDAPPIITSGIKIKTTFDTSTPAITAAISPIAATMANIPKTFSPVRRTDLGYPRTTQLRGRLPAVRIPQHADSTARSVRSSSQSIRSRRRCGLRVRRNLLDDRGSPLDDSAHGGGSRSCAGTSRRRHAGELRTASMRGSRDGSSDVPSLRRDGRRGVRRVRNSGSHWRGHQPHVKRGSALDAPQLRDRDSAGPSLAMVTSQCSSREPRIGLHLARWFRR
jgi:hypothetical protein